MKKIERMTEHTTTS